MQQLLKCYYCGETFDRSKEDYVQVKNRRYAHRKCFENRTNDQIDTDDFWNVITEVFHDYGNYDYRKVDSQLKNYLKQGYTIRGVINAVRYWFVVKGNPITEANKGIGIVPYIYKEAQEYQTYLDKQRADITAIDDMQSTKVQKIQKREKKIETLDFE